MSRRVAVPVLMGSISAARAKEGRLFIEPDLLKQVEVYHDANSALYSSGTIGGVIALPEQPPSRASPSRAGGRAYDVRIAKKLS